MHYLFFLFNYKELLLLLKAKGPLQSKQKTPSTYLTIKSLSGKRLF